MGSVLWGTMASDLAVWAAFGVTVVVLASAIVFFVKRGVGVIVCALIDGAIAYALYDLSQWVGEASPWWYAARFFMAHVMFSAGATLFAATCDLDPTEGGKMRKALR